LGELDGWQVDQEWEEHPGLMMPQVLADMLVFRGQVGQVRGSSLRLLALSSRRYRGATAAGNVGFSRRGLQTEPPFFTYWRPVTLWIHLNRKWDSYAGSRPS